MKKTMIGAIAVALLTMIFLAGCTTAYQIEKEGIIRIELEEFIRGDDATTERRCVAKQSDHSEIIRIINATRTKKYKFKTPTAPDAFIYIYYSEEDFYKVSVDWCLTYENDYQISTEFRRAKTNMVAYIIEHFWNAENEQIIIS